MAHANHAKIERLFLFCSKTNFQNASPENIRSRKEYWNLKACLDFLYELQAQGVLQNDPRLKLLDDKVNSLKEISKMEFLPSTKKTHKCAYAFPDSLQIASIKGTKTPFSKLSYKEHLQDLSGHSEHSSEHLSEHLEHPSEHSSTHSSNHLSEHAPDHLEHSSTHSSEDSPEFQKAIQAEIISNISNMVSILADNSNALADNLKEDSKVVDETSDALLSNYIHMKRENKRLTNLSEKRKKDFFSSWTMFGIMILTFLATYILIRISPY